MRRRGRPVLGAISGMLFGLFFGITLFMFKVYQSDSPMLLVMPVLGLVLGIALALWAPIRRDVPQEAGEVIETP